MAVSASIEPLNGTVDGINKLFTTDNWYKTGSVVVYHNGLAMRQDLDDGWTELGQNKIELNEAPIAGDIMQAYYIPI